VLVLVVLLLLALAIGFILGYAVREFILRHRRRRLDWSLRRCQLWP
jgi:hypothetical protein